MRMVHIFTCILCDTNATLSISDRFVVTCRPKWWYELFWKLDTSERVARPGNRCAWSGGDCFVLVQAWLLPEMMLD